MIVWIKEHEGILNQKSILRTYALVLKKKYGMECRMYS